MGLQEKDMLTDNQRVNWWRHSDIFVNSQTDNQEIITKIQDIYSQLEKEMINQDETKQWIFPKK